MKAMMSEKLREIIHNPQAKKELAKHILKLVTKDGQDGSTEISVNGRLYIIQLTPRNPIKK